MGGSNGSTQSWVVAIPYMIVQTTCSLASNAFCAKPQILDAFIPGSDKERLGVSWKAGNYRCMVLTTQWKLGFSVYCWILTSSWLLKEIVILSYNIHIHAFSGSKNQRWEPTQNVRKTDIIKQRQADLVQ